VVSLKEDADYNDLWEQIMAELSLEKGKAKIYKRTGREKDKISDEELLKQIEAILSEAQEYQEDNIKGKEAEEEEVEEAGGDKEGEEEEKGEEEVKYQFVPAEKTEKKAGKQYQWAVEDNSDLSDFYSILPR
jgi:hypothetical protein